MPFIGILLVAASALVVSLVLTQRFCDPASFMHILDHPNARSLHWRPTPRTGGVAIVTGIGVAVIVLHFLIEMPAFLPWLAGAALSLAVISFLDDRRGLPVVIRLGGHTVSAMLVLFGGVVPGIVALTGMVWSLPEWLGPTLSFLFLIWMVNLYNFMDGMDGFAGGMAVIGFGTFAIFGFLAGNLPFAAVGLVISASAGGFLFFNFPPARIFMGDTGSSVLGLLAGGMILWGARDGVLPFWAGLLVFSPFIVDATVTLLRRVVRGERVWEAHKTHYYQRLVQLGWGHRKTVIVEYGLMLACATSALTANGLGVKVQVFIVCAWCVVYGALMVGVERMIRKRKSA